MKKRHTRSNFFAFFLVSSLAIFAACAGTSGSRDVSGDQQAVSESALQKLYVAAVEDAKDARPDEISYALVPIVARNEKLSWKKSGQGEDLVLTATWTSWTGYDDKIGENVTLERPIWVTTVPELKDFCEKNRPIFPDMNLRLEQLLGLPPGNGKTRVLELWANPDDLFRPSPDPEITDREAELDFPASTNFVTVSPDHIAWFTDLKEKSYGPDGYPWTRLGYTYDWGNPESEVGLSEFVIRVGAKVYVHTVTETMEYCQ